MTVKLDINGPVTGRSLIQNLSSLKVLERGAERIDIVVGNDAFFRCSGLSFLCAWGLKQKSTGSAFTISGAADPVRYLSRMNVHSILQATGPLINRLSEKGRFLPVMLISDDASVFRSSNALCDLVLCQFDAAASFLPAVEWAVNEIIDNVLVHATSPVPGCVCAQYFPAKKRLEVSIVDIGRGIKSSLGQSFVVKNHAEAVEKALQRGVTRDPTVGQGNGMAGAHEIVIRNKGGLEVWTGDTVYKVRQGVPAPMSTIPEVAGTGVVFDLETDNPVDLTQTWIAGGEWSYINVEANRIIESGGIRVAEACVHTNGRSPATPLRRKIVAMCPSLEGPLTLDFSSVRSATSSFLDELLGRLAVELGQKAFHEKIQITGMREALRKQANVVLAQRLSEAKCESKP